MEDSYEQVRIDGEKSRKGMDNALPRSEMGGVKVDVKDDEHVMDSIETEIEK